MRRRGWVGREDEEISHLRRELDSARRTIVGLMPSDINSLLSSYYDCSTRDEAYEWERAVADGIIATIPDEKILSLAHSFLERRAFCPLCGSGSQGPYNEGYKLPDGMKWHFAGHGNTYECPVMRAALQLARDYWDRKFLESEIEQQRIDDEIKKNRLKTETLYIVAPDREAVLLDEGSYSFNPVRSPERLAWAEERLSMLGFECILDERRKAYTRDYESVVVYADHRAEGRITFSVYSKSALPKRKSRRPVLRQIRSFYILDSWKNDLPAKFQQRVDEAAVQLQS